MIVILFWIFGGLCVSLLLFLTLRYVRKSNTEFRNSGERDAGVAEVIPKVLEVLAQTDDFDANLVVVDESGRVLISSTEIQSIPYNAQRLDTTNSSIARQATHLAAELFKGASSLPNKTVQLVFSKEIQEGMREGTYTLMKTRSGEVLADAVNSSNTIVGKGRVVHAGQARQLAAGAFQLVSIAVAQSHLADIDRNLTSIRNAVQEVLSKLEDADKGDIKGTIFYINELAGFMKNLKAPDEMPIQKRNQLESVVRDAHRWREKLHSEFESLIKSIQNQEDMDKSGTGNTYKALVESAAKADALLDRHQLLMRLLSAINIIVAYLDPGNKQYSRVSAESEKMSKLIESLDKSLRGKADTLLSKAIFNSREILDFRKKAITDSATNIKNLALEQSRSHDESMRLLSVNLKNLLKENGEVKVVLSFDRKGDLDSAAIV